MQSSALKAVVAMYTLYVHINRIFSQQRCHFSAERFDAAAAVVAGWLDAAENYSDTQRHQAPIEQRSGCNITKYACCTRCRAAVARFNGFRPLQRFQSLRD